MIGIASVCYLKSGSTIGMFLFAFGLSSVVLFKWPLFTGQAGFTKNYYHLVLVLCLNIVGASLASVFSVYGADLTEAADKIVMVRKDYGFVGCMVNAVACGIIMTTSVKFARVGNWWPLLLGVPTFIICGFPHCIADVGYYVISSCRFGDYWYLWLASVIGNFFGCRIPTMFESKSK